MPKKHKIVFWTRRAYGHLRYYTNDREIGTVVDQIATPSTRRAEPDATEWALSVDSMEALKRLGYTFKQIFEPKKKEK